MSCTIQCCHVRSSQVVMMMPNHPCLLRQDAKKRGDAWSGPDYLASAVPPVLNALVDADARVRYYACEALYNIAKARPTLACF